MGGLVEGMLPRGATLGSKWTYRLDLWINTFGESKGA